MHKTVIQMEEDGSLYTVETTKTPLISGAREAFMMQDLVGRVFLSPVLHTIPNIGHLKLLLAPTTDSVPYAAIQLTHLNFVSDWTLTREDGAAVLRPSFVANHAQENSNIDPLISNSSLLWKVPELLKHTYLFIALGGSVVQALMYTHIPSEHKWFLLPMPNQFSDGRFCWKQKVEVPAVSLCTLMQNAAECWAHSPSNRDLFPTEKENRFTRLFAWSPEGEQVVRTDEQIRANLYEMTNSSQTPAEILPILRAVAKEASQ